MVYDPKLKSKLEEKSENLINVRKWAIGIILSLLGGRYILLEFERINHSFFELMIIGHILLLILTIILVFLWIWATQKELKLCFIWLDPERYSPPSSIKETIMIIGIAILLCALFISSIDPLYFGIVFTTYSVILTFTNKYTMDEIHTAIIGSKSRLRNEQTKVKADELNEQFNKGINVLEEYFIKRPQTKRLIIIDVCCLPGLVLGIIWKVSDIKTLGFITYLSFFCLIFISELVIANWRFIRDNHLRIIESEIDEIKRKQDISTKN